MQLNQQIDGLVAGVDEAGRGPLAGPVVASAVILGRPLPGLKDSKKLTENRREQLAGEIRDKALAWAVAWCDPAEIDALNILEATMMAMHRALLGLRLVPGHVLVDGNRLPDLRLGNTRVSGEAVVKGDDKVPAISAASILAKTVRDSMMQRMHEQYPLYEFSRHKGYGTSLHRERLQEHGPCPEHRFSFAPVRASR